MGSVQIITNKPPDIKFITNSVNNSLVLRVEQAPQVKIILSGIVVGQKGDPGASNYEVWKQIVGNENKTIEEYFSWLRSMEMLEFITQPEAQIDFNNS